MSIFASIFIREIGLKLPFFNGSLYGLSIIVILASYNKLNNVLYLLISHNILKSIGTTSSLKIVTSLAYSRLSQNLTLLPPRILPRVELSSLVHCIVQPLQLFPFMILLPTVRKLNYSRDDTLSCHSSPAASSRLQGCIGRNGTHPSHFISTFAIKHLSFDQEID